MAHLGSNELSGISRASNLVLCCQVCLLAALVQQRVVADAPMAPPLLFDIVNGGCLQLRGYAPETFLRATPQAFELSNWRNLVCE